MDEYSRLVEYDAAVILVIMSRQSVKLTVAMKKRGKKGAKQVLPQRDKTRLRSGNALNEKLIIDTIICEKTTCFSRMAESVKKYGVYGYEDLGDFNVETRYRFPGDLSITYSVNDFQNKTTDCLTPAPAAFYPTIDEFEFGWQPNECKGRVLLKATCRGRPVSHAKTRVFLQKYRSRSDRISL